MLVRKSTLTFVLVAITVFLAGSSLLAWNRPEYTQHVQDKWKDWAGLGAGTGDFPPPINVPNHTHDAPKEGDRPGGEIHILPIGDDDFEIMPHAPEPNINTKLQPILISSEDLVARLRALLSAPVPSYLDALKENIKTCPREVSDRQVNTDQLEGQREDWASVESDDLVRRRLAIVKSLEDLDKEGVQIIGVPGNIGKGRGIVMTGGNQDTTERLLVTLRILREEHKSKLPVEVFSFPGEINDPSLLEELEKLGATVKELAGATKLNVWKNFQIKATSIIHSSFEHVLYLDSDNIPLRDPEYLFDADLYKGTGKGEAVFWPDLNKDHPENPIWRLFGRACDHTEWEMESGQILISKTGNGGMNLAALHVAAHMQAEHEFYFGLSGGDKDTFRYAFWALGIPYSVSPRWMSSLGFHNEYDNGRFCGIAMLQYDIVPPSSGHPHPLFVHANLLKHRNTVPRGSPFTIIKRVSDDIAASPALDAARMWVYTHGGMCVDVEVLEERSEHVVEETWDGVYEGTYKSFGDMYRKHGGRAGGW